MSRLEDLLLSEITGALWLHGHCHCENDARRDCCTRRSPARRRLRQIQKASRSPLSRPIDPPTSHWSCARLDVPRGARQLLAHLKRPLFSYTDEDALELAAVAAKLPAVKASWGSHQAGPASRWGSEFAARTLAPRLRRALFRRRLLQQGGPSDDRRKIRRASRCRKGREANQENVRVEDLPRQKVAEKASTREVGESNPMLLRRISLARSRRRPISLAHSCRAHRSKIRSSRRSKGPIEVHLTAHRPL